MTGPLAETLTAQLAGIRERVALPPGADHEWRWAAGRLLWACDELERLAAAAGAVIDADDDWDLNQNRSTDAWDQVIEHLRAALTAPRRP